MNHFNSIIDEDIQIILSEAIEWKYLSGKTVLVTGASGFIASYIIYTLTVLNLTEILDSPVHIIALARDKQRIEQKFSNIMTSGFFKLIIADVSEKPLIEGNIDIIIHAAGQIGSRFIMSDPVGILKASTIGTANMLDLARNIGVKRFLFISSNAVYGLPNKDLTVITEEYSGNISFTDICSCYSEGKRMGETMCACWSHQFGFHVNMLRLTEIYGPGVFLEKGRVLCDFVNNIINHENIIIHSDGRSKKNLLYIIDAILAIFRVLFYGKNKQAYNVTAETNLSILELANMLCTLFPEKNRSVQICGKEGYSGHASTETKISSDKLKRLGWKQHIAYNDGFKRMVISYLPPPP
jgi:nucleoside-diphosphate-sugar epimerase